MNTLPTIEQIERAVDEYLSTGDDDVSVGNRMNGTSCLVAIAVNKANLVGKAYVCVTDVVRFYRGSFFTRKVGEVRMSRNLFEFMLQYDMGAFSNNRASAREAWEKIKGGNYEYTHEGWRPER